MIELKSAKNKSKKTFSKKKQALLDLLTKQSKSVISKKKNRFIRASTLDFAKLDQEDDSDVIERFLIFAVANIFLCQNYDHCLTLCNHA